MALVIFACVHIAGRSQMAAALFNRNVRVGVARAISAGTNPGDAIYPEVIQVMADLGVDLSGATPQRLTPELAAGARWLITMGAGTSAPYYRAWPARTSRCPIPRGDRSLRWGRFATTSIAASNSSSRQGWA